MLFNHKFFDTSLFSSPGRQIWRTCLLNVARCCNGATQRSRAVGSKTLSHLPLRLGASLLTLRIAHSGASGPGAEARPGLTRSKMCIFHQMDHMDHGVIYRLWRQQIQYLDRRHQQNPQGGFISFPVFLQLVHLG